MLKYLLVSVLMSITTTTAAQRKLSEPVEQALIYADIPPYIEIEPERFDSTIEELLIDGDFVIQLTSAYKRGDYAYVYYRSFAGTDSARQRVLSYCMADLGLGAYLYSDDGAIMTGFRWGLGEDSKVLIAKVFDNALFLLESNGVTSEVHGSIIDSSGKQMTSHENEAQLREAAGLYRDVTDGFIDSAQFSEEEKRLYEKSIESMKLAKNLTVKVPKAELMAMREISATQTVGDVTEWQISIEIVDKGILIVSELAYGDWREKYSGGE